MAEGRRGRENRVCIHSTSTSVSRSSAEEMAKLNSLGLTLAPAPAVATVRQGSLSASAPAAATVQQQRALFNICPLLCVHTQGSSRLLNIHLGKRIVDVTSTIPVFCAKLNLWYSSHDLFFRAAVQRLAYMDSASPLSVMQGMTHLRRCVRLHIQPQAIYMHLIA